MKYSKTLLLLLALLLAVILINGCIDRGDRPRNNTTGSERGDWLIWGIPWGSDSWRYDSTPDYASENSPSPSPSSGGQEAGEDAEPAESYGDFYQTEDGASGETSYGDFYSVGGDEAGSESQSYGDFYSGDADVSYSGDTDWSDSGDSGWSDSGDYGDFDSGDSGDW